MFFLLPNYTLLCVCLSHKISVKYVKVFHDNKIKNKESIFQWVLMPLGSGNAAQRLVSKRTGGISPPCDALHFWPWWVFINLRLWDLRAVSEMVTWSILNFLAECFFVQITTKTAFSHKVQQTKELNKLQWWAKVKALIIFTNQEKMHSWK